MAADMQLADFSLIANGSGGLSMASSLILPASILVLVLAAPGWAQTLAGVTGETALAAPPTVPTTDDTILTRHLPAMKSAREALQIDAIRQLPRTVGTPAWDAYSAFLSFSIHGDLAASRKASAQMTDKAVPEWKAEPLYRDGRYLGQYVDYGRARAGMTNEVMARYFERHEEVWRRGAHETLTAEDAIPELLKFDLGSFDIKRVRVVDGPVGNDWRRVTGVMVAKVRVDSDSLVDPLYFHFIAVRHITFWFEKSSKNAKLTPDDVVKRWHLP
jgi:hypothetical protein